MTHDPHETGSAAAQSLFAARTYGASMALTVLGKRGESVLSLGSYENGRWVVSVVTGEGQMKASDSVSHFETEEQARLGAALIGRAYGIELDGGFDVERPSVPVYDFPEWIEAYKAIGGA